MRRDNIDRIKKLMEDLRKGGKQSKILKELVEEKVEAHEEEIPKRKKRVVKKEEE